MICLKTVLSSSSFHCRSQLFSLSRNTSAILSINKSSQRRHISICLNMSTSIANGSAALSPKEAGKKTAAIAAVDNYLQDGMCVGIGSGTTIVYAVEQIAEKVRKENLKIKCVPTGFQAKELIRKHSLTLTDLSESTSLDVTFDGADEVDEKGTVIKGGGGCHTQEKIVAAASKKLIIICDDSKKSTRLGDNWKKGIPLEVIPAPLQSGVEWVSKKIVKQLGGKVVPRQGTGKMGYVITDNGNVLLDWIFEQERDYDWKSVEITLNMIPGVVENGLFVGRTTEVFFGSNDGSCTKVKFE